MKLSIIIVSWNVADLLKACLNSIGPLPPDWEVIVVDAASSDGTPQMISAAFPQVQLIEPGYNVGFSRGNNLGINASRGSFILMLNPDTIVLGDALAQMLAYLEANPHIAVLGPQLLNLDGTHQSSRRRFPTLLTAMFESTWLQKWAPSRILEHYYARDLPDDAINAVDWVDGAAMMTRRSVVERVGGLDEAYFMYSEELDWQRSIKQAHPAWQIVYFPTARIVHVRGASSDQVSTQRHIRFQTSKIRYFHKHHGAVAALVLRTFLQMSYAWQIIEETLKGAVGHKPELRRQRVSAYWEVLRSGFKETG